MKEKEAFESIRPYKNKEVKEAIEQLLEEPDFQKVLSLVYPTHNLSLVAQKLKNISSIKEFQREVVYYYLTKIIDKTINKLSFSGIDNIKPKKRYMFMSNHRDIILDSALLNVIFFENEIKTTQIAIGSNLLIFPWIEMLVKLNKSFVVRRNIPVREMLRASKELSDYIKHTILKKRNSVWIAQKEGRTKDGNDLTHSGLLKMIHMSSKKPLSKHIKKLKLVPVSISYEIEPCDKLKTAEIYAKMTYGKYTKNPKEDLLSMSGGLHNFKGRVHFHFCKPLNKELEELDNIEVQNEQYLHLAKIIDEKIHENYKLFERNYIAYDMLSGLKKFTDKYTENEYKGFDKYVSESIKDIEGDKEVIKKIFLNIYANPLINKFKLEPIPIKNEE